MTITNLSNTNHSSLLIGNEMKTIADKWSNIRIYVRGKMILKWVRKNEIKQMNKWQ